jgi:hypothetical protein
VDDEEYAGAEEVVEEANDRPVRERKQTTFLADAMQYPASTKSYDAQFLQDSTDTNDSGLREAVENMKRTGSTTEVLRCLNGIVMMQMSAKAGIKKHGQVAIDALFGEFSQLHDLSVFDAQDAAELTRTQKKEALRAIIPSSLRLRFSASTSWFFARFLINDPGMLWRQLRWWDRGE